MRKLEKVQDKSCHKKIREMNLISRHLLTKEKETEQMQRVESIFNFFSLFSIYLFSFRLSQASINNPFLLYHVLLAVCDMIKGVDCVCFA